MEMDQALFFAGAWLKICLILICEKFCFIFKNARLFVPEILQYLDYSHVFVACVEDNATRVQDGISKIM